MRRREVVKNAWPFSLPGRKIVLWNLCGCMSQIDLLHFNTNEIPSFLVKTLDFHSIIPLLTWIHKHPSSIIQIDSFMSTYFSPHCMFSGVFSTTLLCFAGWFFTLKMIRLDYIQWLSHCKACPCWRDCFVQDEAGGWSEAHKR